MFILAIEGVGIGYLQVWLIIMVEIEAKAITMGKDDEMPKSITIKILNGANYLACAHAVKIFLRGKKKSRYISELPPPTDDKDYDDWCCEDSCVMGWIWHSLEPQVATTVEFCDTSKAIWDSLAESFSTQSNVSRVYELYEQIFAMRQSGRSLPDYYSSLKTLWDQLLQHRPFTTDVTTQKQHWEEFMMASLLSGLDPELRGFKDQILASDTLPSAANAYSRLLRSSLGQAQSTVGSSLSSSALVSSSGDHGSTRGGFHSSSGSRSSSFGSRGSRGGGSRSGGSRGRFRGGSSSGPGSRIRGDRKCTHCGSQGHTEPWCWQKHGRPDHVHQVMYVPSSQSSLLSTGSDASPFNSYETLTTQISELTALVQSLRPNLASSSTATIASSGNVA